MRIPIVFPPFETPARAVWCRGRGDGYELGLQFVAPDDAYAARMDEQICHIEDYHGFSWQADAAESSKGCIQ